MHSCIVVVGGDTGIVEVEVGVGLVAVEIAGPVVAVGLIRMGRIMAIMFDVAVGTEEHTSGFLQLAELCSGVVDLGEICGGIVQGSGLREVVVGPEELIGEEQQTVGAIDLHLGETGVGDTAGIEQISPFGPAECEPHGSVDVMTPVVVVVRAERAISVVVWEYTVVDTL